MSSPNFFHEIGIVLGTTFKDLGSDELKACAPILKNFFDGIAANPGLATNPALFMPEISKLEVDLLAVQGPVSTETIKEIAQKLADYFASLIPSASGAPVSTAVPATGPV